jgi:carboxymethylenebutenolidase
MHTANNPQSDNVVHTAYDPTSWNIVAEAVSEHPDIVATIVYAEIAQKGSIRPSNVPTLHHIAGKRSDNPKISDQLKEYHYPFVDSYTFATPFQSSFHYTTEALSHTRNLTHLKPRMDGPYFDLEAIWDEHCYYEFTDRSVEHTMSTMVAEPYVNHVPTVRRVRDPDYESNLTYACSSQVVSVRVR